MHNTLTRLQNVFGYFTTVGAALGAAIAVISLLSTSVPNIGDTGLRLNNLLSVRGRPHYYSTKKEEYVHIKFDLDIDLSSLFTWNTKQVFLYITATYPSSKPNTAPSQVVVWDAILPHPLAPSHHNTYSYPVPKDKTRGKSKDSRTRNPPVPGLLKLDAQRPKYQITDFSGRIAERPNATLELNWNIQPWVGALHWASTPSRAKGSGKASLLSPLTWRTIGSKGARTSPFDFPPVKERAEAAKAAGKEGLGTERGAEANRGRPA